MAARLCAGRFGWTSSRLPVGVSVASATRLSYCDRSRATDSDRSPLRPGVKDAVQRRARSETERFSYARMTQLVSHANVHIANAVKNRLARRILRLKAGASGFGRRRDMVSNVFFPSSTRSGGTATPRGAVRVPGPGVPDVHFETARAARLQVYDIGHTFGESAEP